MTFSKCTKTKEYIICTECNNKKVKSTNIKQHIKQFHSGEEKQEHFCKICRQKFSRKSGLSTHVKNVHQSKEELKCMECDFQTRYKSYLKEHQDRKHSMLPVYRKCDNCSYQTFYTSTLNRHKQSKHKDINDLITTI